MNFTSLSDLAASFPTVEVEYEDLLQYRYVPDARGENGTIDCLGILIELYRRAGLGVPDLMRKSDAVLNFHTLFYEVEAADQLFDVVANRRGVDHLWTVVRPGLALSTKTFAGVVAHKVGLIEGLEGSISYRPRPECLPSP